MKSRVLFLLSLLLFIFGIGTVAAQSDGVVLIVPERDSPKSMNPNWQNDAGVYSPSSSIFSHLIVLDWGVTQGVSAYGDLAESWDVSDDGLIYTFHLYDGVKWHDGEPLTSADVKYTYDTAIENGYPLAAVLSDVKEIRTPDDLTVEIELNQPVAAFIGNLAQASDWYGKILPQHLYEGTDWATSPANDHPIGSGPFKFVEWEPDSHVTLEANDDYFRGRPAIDTLIFQYLPDINVAVSSFQAGDFPYLPNQYVPSFGEISAMRNDPAQADTVIETPSIYTRELYLNQTNEYLANPKVRQAIAYAVDRDAINQSAFSGLWPTVNTPGIPVLGDYLNTDATFPAHDAAMAEQLLDEAGYPRGADGWRFPLEVTNPSIADTELIAEVLVQQLREVGINATWQKYDSATWNEKMANGDFDASMYFVRYGPDPDAYREHFRTDAPRNFMGYSNARVDELLDQGKYEPDTATRIELYKEVQQILAQDMVSIPLFWQDRFSFVDPRWTGFPVQEDSWGKGITWFGMYAVQPPTE
jgi:peptide/nickel transport system substrate-binding protein